MKSPYELWSLIIAGMALLVSLFAIIHSAQTTRRQSKTDERLRGLQEELTAYQVEDERRRRKSEAHAELRAELEKRGQGERIIIQNVGAAEARSVTFEVKSMKTGKSPLVPNDTEMKLPITTLPAGDECPLMAATSSDSYAPFEYTVRWTDPDGRAREYTGKLYG